MPVLERIKTEFARDNPLDGVNIIACLHVTVETANLIRTLQAGGATSHLPAQIRSAHKMMSRLPSPKSGIVVCAFRGESDDEYYMCMEEALKIGPQVTLDDGADVIATVHGGHKEYLNAIMGGCEETTTGVVRLRPMAAEGALKYPS